MRTEYLSWWGPKAEAEAAAGETTRKESTQIMIVIIFTHYLHTFLVLFTLGYNNNNNNNSSRSNSIHSICNISQRLCAPRHVSCLSRSFAARSRPSRPGGHDLVILQFQRLLSAVSSYIHCCWLLVGVWRGRGGKSSIDSSSILSCLVVVDFHTLYRQRQRHRLSVRLARPHSHLRGQIVSIIF